MKALWMQCFPEDDESYINLFYSYYGHPRYHHTIEKGGKVISMLHHIDTYRYNLFDKNLRCSYIYAACTAPEQQGKGLMGQLMEKTLLTLHEKHIPLCVTIPAKEELFAFYGRFGFVPAFKRWYARWRCSGLPYYRYTEMSLQHNIPQEVAVEWLTTAINSRFTGNMRHTQRDIRFVVESTLQSGGFVVGMVNGEGELRGIAIGDKTRQALRVRDFTTVSPHDISYFIDLLRCSTQLHFWLELTEPNARETFFGAARIVDLPLLMKRTESSPRTREEETFYIKDPIISANNGLYQFADRHFSFLPCLPPEHAEDGIPVYDIAEYTRKLFEIEPGHMTLMMD